MKKYKFDRATTTLVTISIIAMIMFGIIVIISAMYKDSYKQIELLNEEIETLKISNDDMLLEYNDLYNTYQEVRDENNNYQLRVEELENQLQYEDRIFQGTVSAYCGDVACVGKYATDDETKYGATGIQLVPGRTCASDYFPIGTVLYIEGYGQVTVADRFGSNRDKRYIDLFMNTHESAEQWGIQNLEIIVIKEIDQ